MVSTGILCNIYYVTSQDIHSFISCFSSQILKFCALFFRLPLQHSVCLHLYLIFTALKIPRHTTPLVCFSDQSFNGQEVCLCAEVSAWETTNNMFKQTSFPITAYTTYFYFLEDRIILLFFTFPLRLQVWLICMQHCMGVYCDAVMLS